MFSKQKVKEAVDVDAIEPVLSTNSLRIRRRWVDVAHDGEGCGNAEDDLPLSLLSASLLSTALTRHRFGDGVPATLHDGGAPLQYSFKESYYLGPPGWLTIIRFCGYSTRMTQKSQCSSNAGSSQDSVDPQGVCLLVNRRRALISADGVTARNVFETERKKLQQQHKRPMSRETLLRRTRTVPRVPLCSVFTLPVSKDVVFHSKSVWP